jgi:hypothetical protein
MPKARQAQLTWPICVVVLLTYLGIALILIGLGESHRFELWLRCLIYVVGFALFLSGIFLMRKDQLSAPQFPEEPTLEPPEPEGVYLGSFDLNGYSFKAYECQIAKDGRQFRLISFPPLTPEREAAFIRYIVNESLIENMCQGTSKKIEEEAAWAFLH